MTQYPPTNPNQPLQGLREAPGATAGLVLGIISIVLTFPVVGLILAWIGYSKSKQARELCALNPGMFSNEGVAQAGYVCSIIGLILNSVVLLGGCCAVLVWVLLVAGGVAAVAGASAAGGGAMLFF